MNDKHVKAGEIVQQLTAEFLSRESNRTSLITVTGIDLSPDMGRATILVTVFPEDKVKGALDFLNRKRDDVRIHLKQNSKLRRLPRISFAIDEGEKNRQRIDELLSED
jgi:ribosome-binding factor A